MQSENSTSYIYTFTGRKFPLYGKPEDVHIEDVAHALAEQCRFTGHLRERYSVAQHSVWGAKWLQVHGYDRVTQAIFLFHDASEAYLADLARPFKSEVKGYKEIENSLQARIMRRFGLPANRWPGIIKIVDMLACYVEARDLHHPGVWEDFTGIDDKVECLTSNGKFEGTFRELVYREPPVESWPQDLAEDKFLDWYEYYVSREVINA